MMPAVILVRTGMTGKTTQKKNWNVLLKRCRRLLINISNTLCFCVCDLCRFLSPPSPSGVAENYHFAAVSIHWKKDISNQQLSTQRANIFTLDLSIFLSPFLSLSHLCLHYLILCHYSHLSLSLLIMSSSSDPSPQWSFHVFHFQSPTPSVSLHTILQAWQQKGHWCLCFR